MAQRGLWNLARERMLQDRGALPKEEGYSVRGYKATQEEKFLSSCLRKWKIWGKKEKERRESVNPVSKDASEEFCHGEDSDSCGIRGVTFWVTPVVLSHCVSEVSSVVPVVTDVLVFPSSSAVVMSEALVSGSDW